MHKKLEQKYTAAYQFVKLGGYIFVNAEPCFRCSLESTALRGNFKTSIKMRFDMFALALKTYFAVCSYSSIRFLRHCKTSHCAFCASFEITSSFGQ